VHFSEEHQAFRQLVRGYVNKEINPHVDEWEAAGEMPLHDLFAEMAGLGFFGLELDEEYGGQGADHRFTLILAEELGRADHGSIGMAVGVQVEMATPSLAQYGTPDQKEQFLKPAMQGKAVASIAVTEPGAGSDVSGIQTKATRDGDEWIINGSKMFITNAVQADWLCTLVRTSDEGGYAGMSQIIIPTDAPGFEVSKKLDKLGMRASDTGVLSFTDCRVPVANTIGEAGSGFQQQMSQFVQERMWANYSSVGGMDRALARTKEYLLERHAFGKPLMANQHLQYRLAELAAEVDMLRHYNRATATVYMAGEDPTRMATIGKIKAGKLSREVADVCLQFHGGTGYMEETWTARYLRDNRLLSIGGGSDETMLQVLARIDGYWA